MKRLVLVLVIAIVLGITLLGYSQTAPGLAQSRPAVLATPNSARVEAALQGAPVMFIENVGQFAEGASFQVRGGNGTMWIAEDAIWITVLEQTNPSPQPLPEAERGAPHSLAGKEAGGLGRHGVNLKLTFPGANPRPRLEPFDRLDTHVSYFIGNDPAKWRPDVPVWGGVRYVDLYPGIDLEITSENGYLVQRLVARPGADLNAVRLQVEGADAIELRPSPDVGSGAGGEALGLTTAVGEYTLPLLAVEGLNLPRANAQRVNAQAFDITNPFSSTPSTSAPLHPSTSAQGDLLYATFLGGDDREWGRVIAIDSSGAAYVMGTTWSSDFPTTPGAFDTSFNGDWDAFVVKLNGTGSALTYATFLGGGDMDTGLGIAIDSSGAAYVTGWAGAPDFPTTPGAFDTSYNGGSYDAFVAKLAVGGGPCYDFDEDGQVDVDDIMEVASRWRCKRGDACYDSRYDVDGDSDIDIVDIMKVAAHWGEGC